MKVLKISQLITTAEIKDILQTVKGEGRVVLELQSAGAPVEIGETATFQRRAMSVMDATGAVGVYSNYRETDTAGDGRQHPVAAYHAGCVRDDFDFGHLMLADVEALMKGIEMTEGDERFGGWYALRLALSRLGEMVHIPETLYSVRLLPDDREGERQFDYVNPRNREVQEEMEKIFTRHLNAIGGAVGAGAQCPQEDGEYPVEASVIIPVKNRVRTVGDAVRSALGQKTDFPFNVIVVDNHSTDGTTELLKELSAEDERVVHIIPEEEWHGIGGCWNIGVNAKECGRYAVQLDSDDLYSGEDTLSRIVELFRSEKCGMVIGSYELVDFQGNPIPPGLISHAEWTDANGANNALRINGLGAPRAFLTRLVRKTGFPDVSYGEDYAMALAISGEWHVGRIYDSLYLCRRWEGNSDAALTPEKINANNIYKDRIREWELKKRIHRNGAGK